MEKQIKAGLVKSLVVGSTYVDAKVVYANEFNGQGFERLGIKTYGNEMDMPDGQYSVYHKGVDGKYREGDEWFLVYEGERPEEAETVGGVVIVETGDIKEYRTREVLGFTVTVVCLDGIKRQVVKYFGSDSYSVNNITGKGTPCKNLNKERYGKELQSWVDEKTAELEGGKTQEIEPEPQTAPKLSKTMQAVIDKLHKADWYYMHDGKACKEFADENGFRPIGFEECGIVEGGYVYSYMSSNTLRALEKRGLIEIAHDGKGNSDAVKVVGMGLPKRIEKALMVKITRTNKEHPEWKPSVFTGYATSEEAVRHLIDRYTRGSNTATAEIVGEVELTVWDFFKNK